MSDSHDEWRDMNGDSAALPLQLDAARVLERAEFYLKMFKIGSLSLDEGRRREGWPQE